MANDVVVGERPADPAVGNALLEGADAAAEMRRREFRPEQVERVAHVQLVAAGRIGSKRLQRAGAIADLADRRAVLIGVEQRSQALQEVDVFRLCLVVEVALHAVGVGIGSIQPGGIVARQGRRIVAQLLVAEVVVHRVQTKSVDTAIEPEFDGGKHRILDTRVVEIEIRLRCEEIVLVILAADTVPLPAGAAENRQPVVRRRAVWLGVGPDVPVGFRIVAARAAFDEPGMDVRCMRDHLVDNHLDPERMGGGHHLVEIGQCPENRVDIAIVGDIVPHVCHRRGEERRQPDRVYPERGDVGQTQRDALDVAKSVAVGILEGSWIDLIDYRTTPPVLRRRSAR